MTEPKLLECFREATQMGLMQIRSISCGENHSLALVDMDLVQIEEDDEATPVGEEGQQQAVKVTRLFVWGCNDKKQLGLNQELTEGSGTDEVNSNGERSGAGSSTTVNQDIRVP